MNSTGTDPQFLKSPLNTPLGTSPMVPKPVPQIPLLVGWLCPRCGCCNGPSMKVCGRCTPPTHLEVTC